MTDRIDHAAEAQKVLAMPTSVWGSPSEVLADAQVYATIAVAEQLRIGNLIAYRQLDPDDKLPVIAPDIAAALGIDQIAHQIAETTAAAGATAQEFVSAALALASFPSDARVEAAARVIWRWYVGENLDGFDKHAYIYDREKAMGAALEALKAAWEVGE